MQDLPHTYSVSAASTPEGDIALAAAGLPAIASAAPTEFGGPGNRWSPETLLVAAVADCFTLSFRAVAAASKLAWVSLDVSASGTLDKVERRLKDKKGSDFYAVVEIEAEREESKVARINVTIEERLLREIDEEAEARGLSRSGFLAEAARTAMRKAAPGRGRPTKHVRKAHSA